jgi:hypothetical protein
VSRSEHLRDGGRVPLESVPTALDAAATGTAFTKLEHGLN